MRILIDLDGTTVDMLTPLIELYNKKYDKNLTIHDVTGWTLPKGMKELFHEENKFFRTLPFIDGAYEAILELQKDNELFFATDPGKNPYIACNKMLWWQDVGLTHIPMILTERKDILDADVLIDDAPHNIEAFYCKDRNRYAILFTAKYNEHVKENGHILRANNWQEVLSIVGGLK